MDSVGIVSIIIIVGIILIFIVYFIIAKKKKKNTILRIITQQAIESGCKISEFDSVDNFIIGIDNDSHLVFFYNLIDQTKTMINLTEIQKCKINQVSRSIGSGKNIQSATDRLELVFLPRDNKKADIVLECYNSNQSSQLGNELVILEKWQVIISDQLNNLTRKK